MEGYTDSLIQRAELLVAAGRFLQSLMWYFGARCFGSILREGVDLQPHWIKGDMI